MFKLKIIDKPQMFKLKCNFDFPDIPIENLQEKKVEPTTNIQEIKADTGYVGLSKVIVDKVTNKIDDNIVPSNIKKDVSILGVTGNVVELQGEERTITPTKEIQIIEPSIGKNAITKATINAIPDEYIIPSGTIEINSNGNYNVKEKEFANVNVPEKQLGTKTITTNGTYKATDDNLDGYSEVNVETSGVDINEYFTSAQSGNAGTSLQTAIKKVPSNLDISKLTQLSSFFRACYNLTEIPLLDTSKITAMDNTFAYCTGIITIPLLDTSNVIAMGNMFDSCSNLKSIPKLNMNKVVNMYSMFEQCYNLQEIPQLNVPNIVIISRAFHFVSKLEDFGGLLNLGQAYLTSRSANYSNYTLNLSYSTKLTHDSLMNVINGLYDIATKGVKTQQLVLGSTNLAKLTAEEISLGTSKGWSIS